jgi:hypothetical protein
MYKKRATGRGRPQIRIGYLNLNRMKGRGAMPTPQLFSLALFYCAHPLFRDLVTGYYRFWGVFLFSNRGKSYQKGSATRFCRPSFSKYTVIPPVPINT